MEAKNGDKNLHFISEMNWNYMFKNCKEIGKHRKMSTGKKMRDITATAERENKKNVRVWNHLTQPWCLNRKMICSNEINKLQRIRSNDAHTYVQFYRHLLRMSCRFQQPWQMGPGSERFWLEKVGGFFSQQIQKKTTTASLSPPLLLNDFPKGVSDPRTGHLGRGSFGGNKWDMVGP